MEKRTQLVTRTDTPRILVVDDEPEILRQLRWGLSGPFEVFVAEDADQAMHLLREHRPDVAALDMALDGKDTETGLTLLDQFLSFDPLLKVVMVTGHEARENGLKAVDRGAYDFFTKPVDLDELLILLKRAVSVRKLELENATLREKLRREGSLGRLIGQSREMQSVFRMIRKVAPTDVTVLVQGDSGTGKDLVAQELHRLSPRAGRPVVSVSCSALPEAVLEAELFGPKGQNGGTGHGKLRAANGGTMILDEVESLPLTLQARVSRFLEEQDMRLSSGHPTDPLDVRFLVCTSVDLRDLVTQGNFREDLYFRISVVSIQLPALRNRKEDIVYLAQRFLERYAAEYGRGKVSFSRAALRSLQRCPWSGNVRELEHRVQRGIVLSRGRVIRAEDLELEGDDLVDVVTLRMARERAERRVVVDSLRRNCGNIARAAREMEISRPTLHDLLRKLEIRAADYKNGVGPEEDRTGN